MPYWRCHFANLRSHHDFVMLCSQEGPHSTLPDDEFYDAVETGFDKMEEERRAKLPPPVQHTRDQVDLPPPAIDNRLTAHPLWTEVRQTRVGCTVERPLRICNRQM